MQRKLKNKNSIFVNYTNNYKNINTTNIKKLIKLSEFSKSNSRYCLHKKTNDKHQEMIIVQKKGKYFPPKKNSLSDQSFLLLKGKLLIIIFSSKGKIKKKIILTKDNFYLRVKKNTYHCDIPLTNYSIHLETKNCLFTNKTNKLARFKFNYKKINLNG